MKSSSSDHDGGSSNIASIILSIAIAKIETLTLKGSRNQKAEDQNA